MVAMRRWLIALAVILAAAVTAVAAVYYVTIHPWLAAPDGDSAELEQQWRDVEDWARPANACYGSADLLIVAARSMAAVDGDVHDAVTGADGWPPQVDHTDLPPEFDHALMSLLQWHLDGGGVDPAELDEAVGALAVFELGKAAVSSAGSVDPALVEEAVLRLGWTYRECGQMIHGAIGFQLAELVAENAQQRGTPPTQAHHTYRPTQEQIFGIAAREAVFTHELASTEMKRSLGAHNLNGAPGIVPGLVDPDRELAMLRQFWGSRLCAASADRSDGALLVRQFEAEEAEDLPRSLVVRIIGLGTDHMIQNLVDGVREYDAFLKDTGGAD